MLVKDANDRVESIENEINYWLDIKEIKELNENSINDLDDEFKNIFSDIDIKIDKLYEERNALNKIIDEHLNKTSSYNELLKKIIHYKEEVPEYYSWKEISNELNYSVSYLKNTYSKYKKQRNV